MNARIDLPAEDNVVNLLDLLERRSAAVAGERKTVARLQTVPRAPAPVGEATPVRRVERPSMSPVDLVRRAARIGTLTAVTAGACTLAYSLASGDASMQQTPWLVAFVALMAFSFGASLGSISSLVAQRELGLAALRRQRHAEPAQNGT